MVQRSQNNLLPAIFPIQTRLSTAAESESRAVVRKQTTPPATNAAKVVPREPYPHWEKGVLVDYYT